MEDSTANQQPPDNDQDKEERKIFQCGCTQHHQGGNHDHDNDNSDDTRTYEITATEQANKILLQTFQNMAIPKKFMDAAAGPADSDSDE